jgi:hypothetical protein
MNISWFPMVPPHFDWMDYAIWCHTMKVWLILLNLSVWKVVCTCVEFRKEGETPDKNQLQQIHYNAQATNVFLSSLEKVEYDRVDGLEKANWMWETLLSVSWRYEACVEGQYWDAWGATLLVCDAWWWDSSRDVLPHEALGQESESIWVQEME